MEKVSDDGPSDAAEARRHEVADEGVKDAETIEWTFGEGEENGSEIAERDSGECSEGRINEAITEEAGKETLKKCEDEEAVETVIDKAQPAVAGVLAAGDIDGVSAVTGSTATWRNCCGLLDIFKVSSR